MMGFDWVLVGWWVGREMGLEVVWLVGAGLKPAPTGWLTGCLVGCPAVGEGGWEGVDDAGGLDGGVGDGVGVVCDNRSDEVDD